MHARPLRDARLGACTHQRHNKACHHAAAQARHGEDMSADIVLVLLARPGLTCQQSQTMAPCPQHRITRRSRSAPRAGLCGLRREWLGRSHGLRALRRTTVRQAQGACADTKCAVAPQRGHAVRRKYVRSIRLIFASRTPTNAYCFVQISKSHSAGLRRTCGHKMRCGASMRPRRAT